jgi:hypothetical protein
MRCNIHSDRVRFNTIPSWPAVALDTMHIPEDVSRFAVGL